jgi:hypothetical protein
VTPECPMVLPSFLPMSTALSSGIKLPEREANHSPRSSAPVKRYLYFFISLLSEVLN